MKNLIKNFSLSFNPYLRDYLDLNNKSPDLKSLIWKIDDTIIDFELFVYILKKKQANEEINDIEIKFNYYKKFSRMIFSQPDYTDIFKMLKIVYPMFVNYIEMNNFTNMLIDKNIVNKDIDDKTKIKCVKSMFHSILLNFLDKHKIYLNFISTIEMMYTEYHLTENDDYLKIYNDLIEKFKNANSKKFDFIEYMINDLNERIKRFKRIKNKLILYVNQEKIECKNNLIFKNGKYQIGKIYSINNFLLQNMDLEATNYILNEAICKIKKEEKFGISKKIIKNILKIELENFKLQLNFKEELKFIGEIENKKNNILIFQKCKESEKNLFFIKDTFKYIA